MINRSEVFFDDDYVEELLTQVIEWTQSDAPDWFDDSFVHQMYINNMEGRSLTPGQVKGLENIRDKFQIA